jgi:NAD(P)-dependent dehydrogenase (short-subunit alcohol dehydrogenase family)
VIALVTGVGSKGQVGEAVAAALAERGDTVIVVSRDAMEVQARAVELRRGGRSVHAYGCDLADERAVADLAERVKREHGARLDALVNLAGGFGLTGRMAESDRAAVDRLYRINFTTAYLATRAFLSGLRDAQGSIVYFASEKVIEGARTSGVAGYVAAKAAVVALMRSVADEGREHGVRSNALAPASIRTATNEESMGANAPYVEREDVARAILFLCSPAARAISGQVIRLRV